MTAVVLAFDGLIADTLDARTESLQYALSAEGIGIESGLLRSVLPGRTFLEAVTAVLGDTDPTVTDLAALRAQKDASLRFAHGVSLAPNAHAYVDAQRASGVRLVLRADSLRPDVERVLLLTGLEDAFTFVRCPGDLPRGRGVSTLEASYAAISKRLDALRVESRSAIECTSEVADVARRLIGRATSTGHLDVSGPRH